jgi:hypothetical protein
MSLLLTRVLWYRIDDVASENEIVTYLDPIDITDAINWNVSKGLDIQNNNLTVNLRNEWSKYVDDTTELIKFQEEDQIKVYAKYVDDNDDITSAWTVNSTTLPNSADSLGVYFVKQFGIQGTTKGTRIKLTCVDKTYVLFNKVFSQAWAEDDGYNSPYMIKKVIRQTSENPNGEFEGDGEDEGVNYEIDARYVSDGGYITDVRTDRDNVESQFPTKGIGKAWKPVYDWIKDLSAVDAINSQDEINDEDYIYGRPFIYYVDELNRFHWESPDYDNPTEIIVGIDDVYNINMDKVIFGTANMIIYNAGEDMNGRGIWGYYLHEASNIKGLQMKVVPMIYITRDAIDYDYGIDYTVPADRKSGDNNDAGYPYPQFPTNARYAEDDYACYFVSPNLDTYQSSSDVTNDSTYNAALREYAHWKAKQKSESLCAGLANAKWRGKVEVKGARYAPGELIKLTDATSGLNEEELRLTGAKHNITNRGWFTSLELEKDPETLIK